MALIIISLLVIVPLVLLAWDLSRKPSAYSSNYADVEPNAPRANGSAIRVHA